MKALDARAAATRALVVPDKILVATDLTDLDYLIPHAVAQGRACGAALTLIHVIPPGEALSLNARAIPYEDSAAMAAEATRLLEDAAAGIRNGGTPCDVLVVHGFPREQIPQAARDIGAGRIIAGTHGRRRLRRFLLGSVAHEILRSAEVPVYTIGPHAHEASSFGAPQRILHPVSLAEGFEESARVAFDLAQFYRAEITLLHVLNEELRAQPDLPRITGWAKSELQRVIPEEAELWTHARVQVEIGDVVEQVLDVSSEVSADLIVLGLTDEVGFWPIRGDDTVYRIIAQAKSPVLSIRRRAVQ
ncbi:MAG TPA: universal stress protein [Acidobacteriaceae bacterium]|nr:universal stress protein [Acidobacteriaceae bacterium]